MVGQCGDGACVEGGQRLERKSKGQSTFEESCEGNHSPLTAAVLLLMMMMMMMMMILYMPNDEINMRHHFRSGRQRKSKE
jgi:hypothetical protein